MANDTGNSNDASLEFDSLRQSGIDFIQRLSGSVWTDFNLHDPGVTILEQVCYAITDLAYRGDFNIEELIAEEKGEISFEHNSFFKREQIFSSSPVTLNDFRKIVLDQIPGIENAWFYIVENPLLNNQLKGLIAVKIQLKRDKITGEIIDKKAKTEADHTAAVKEYTASVKKQVNDLLVSRRNICELFAPIADIKILDRKLIRIKAEIQTKENIITEDLIARLYVDIQAYLNRSVDRHSEGDLQSKGYSVSDIYSGPLLSKGLILDSDLLPQRKFLEYSEITEQILKYPDVTKLDKFGIFNEDGTPCSMPLVLNSDTHVWWLLDKIADDITVYANDSKKNINLNLLRSYLNKPSIHDFTQDIAATTSVATTRPARYRPTENYFSFQKGFPAIYGIGPEGLEGDASPKRRGEAKQLKAYLMLFEQLMANHLSQLGNIKRIFSVHEEKDTEKDSTYYVQGLYDVPGAEYLIKAFTDKKDPSKPSWEQFISEENNQYIQSLKKINDSPDDYFTRKARVLDHILARYNEWLSMYAVGSFDSVYDTGKDYFYVNSIKYRGNYFNKIVGYGLNRSTGVNYTKDRETTHLECKITHLLNINRCAEDLSTVEIPGTKAPLYGKLTDVFTFDPIGRMSLSIKKKEGSGDRGYNFRGITTAFFKDAINPRNYCVCKHTETEYITYYFVKDDKQVIPPGAYEKVCDRKEMKFHVGDTTYWREDLEIHRHTSDKAARESLKDLVKQLKAISINSEGFHIVEHILLAPSLHSSSFGFVFNATGIDDFLKLANYTTFEARNKIIAHIATAANGKNWSMDKKSAFIDELYERGVMFKADSTRSKTGKAELIIDTLNKQRYAPGFFNCFQPIIKLEDGNLVREDFFNLRVTVVLPSWPARFQNENYDTYMKNVFKTTLPAHITINFLELDIFDMKKFEDTYFAWLDKKTIAEKNPYTDKLLSLIGKDLLVS